MPIHKLTKSQISKAKPGRHADGGGLALRVSKQFLKNWRFRYSFNGRQYEMGLGSLDDVSLEEARERASRYRKSAKEGYDPRVIRDEEREKNIQWWEKDRGTSASIPTFTSCAAQYIRSKRRFWNNHKHAKQWTRSLKTYARPVIGNKPVNTITLSDIKSILNPIWMTKTETASRLQNRMENVIDFAIVHGYRKDNPARWRNYLNKILPSPRKVHKVKHHPAMPYHEVPAFLAKLRAKRSCSSVNALEFLILTGTRTTEVLKATWDEIDLDERVWIIPRDRMKNRQRQHRVPLSEQALALLKKLPRINGNPYLFPGARKGKPLCSIALLQVMRKMGHGAEGPGKHYVVHGFRSSFRDWAGEAHNSPPDVANMALAHTVKNKAEAAYRRGDSFDKRRKLMQDWADYLIS
ncbi:MAG: tyrosine-type recombinase/integrase [Candidatus Thiodiazotropha lotti]|nr:tyrosine-type recombinase/integrase [Candidatus Thiodiazotropha lotti]